MPPGQSAGAAYRVTCPGYFKALGIPIVEGRDFDERDSDDRCAGRHRQRGNREALLAQCESRRPAHEDGAVPVRG